METWHSFDLISHPDRTLERHLGQCNTISKRALQTKYFTPAFYSKDQIEIWRKWLVYYHDFGKATDYFQFRIIMATVGENGHPEFRENMLDYILYFQKEKADGLSDALNKNSELGSHSKLGAYFLFANFNDEDKIVEIILQKVILRHHGYLTNFSINKNNEPVISLDEKGIKLLSNQSDKHNFLLFNKILAKNDLESVSFSSWEPIVTRFRRQRFVTKLETQLKIADTYKYFLLQHYLFSLLLTADKGDMTLPKSNSREFLIRENIIVDPKESVVEGYKILEFGGETTKNIDLKREAAFKDISKHVSEYSSENFFSITLPTGMGKTFSAYKAAFLLQKKFEEQTSTKPHIVYCLPFTSVIDQNAAVLLDILKKNNLKTDLVAIHHYLSSFNEGFTDDREEYQKLEFTNSEYLTESWEHDVVVTTFVQFLESIFTNRNRAIRKFHNLVHSVIVLDEVQAIPPKYFNAIEDIFRAMAEYFGTKFIFVTATQPMLFEGRKDIIELTDPSLIKTKKYFEDMNRINLDQSLLKSNSYEKNDFEEIKNTVFNDIIENPNKSFLIICNTIALSQEMFHFLANNLTDDSRMRYLSSYIIPFSRKDRIEEIKKSKEKLILVSTQVVEAGVDLDFDVVYRDWAPLDSINQSAGRCNRNGLKGKGVVKLFNSGKSRIYLSQLLSATKEVFKNYDEIIPESQFLYLNEKYTQLVWKAVAKENDISNSLRDAMKNLNLENVNEQFKLIQRLDITYNVFIPINKEAKAVWNEFQNILKIKDRWKRKDQMKILRPRLVSFVTRFPKKYYQPPKGQEEFFLIEEPNWKDYYDEITGFKNPNLLIL